jgi:Terminase large subunit, T4likevirus-type, N-terminal
MLAEIEALAMALDPSLLMEAVGLPPDPWQAEVLRTEADRVALLCSRQMGKSSTTAVLALGTALFEPDSLVLLISPSLRQSNELYRKVVAMYDVLDRPIPSVVDNATTLALDNGSRVVSLPGSPTTIRGFSAPRLVVLDEAALVEDAMLGAVLPMLAVGGGRLILLSTPAGQRGFFYEIWTEGGPEWQRVKATAEDCPRISREFLAEQQRTLGPRWYRQEFLCSFEATIDQVFTTESVNAAFASDLPPLFEDPSTFASEVPALFQFGGNPS